MNNIIKIYNNPLSEWDTIKLETKNRAGIYCWTNKINNKKYVGQAKDLWLRIIDYGQPWYLRTNTTFPIVRAFKKYGIENFSLTILEFITADETELGLVLDLAENNAIKEIKPKYNILQQANSSRGWKHSEETKKYLSELKTGTHHSLETRQKMSENRKGVNNPNFGKTPSKAVKEKLKIAALNRTKSHKPATLVEITDVTTNIITQYPSIRKAAEGIQCTYSSLQYYQMNYWLNNNKSSPLFKNKYSIKFIKP